MLIIIFASVREHVVNESRIHATFVLHTDTCRPQNIVTAETLRISDIVNTSSLIDYTGLNFMSDNQDSPTCGPCQRIVSVSTTRRHAAVKSCHVTCVIGDELTVYRSSD